MNLASLRGHNQSLVMTPIIIYLENVKGYLPTAGKIEWPVLEPFSGGLGYGR